MEQIGDVIVFGDSLSDIGTKWTSLSGRFALKAGAMTVNPTGRFSDCRNWADYMYEEAAGSSLILGNSAATITASRAYLSLSTNSFVVARRGGAQKGFRYANYAEGGACGASPAISLSKPALGEFKDQVRKYSKEYRGMTDDRGAGRPILFIVWFGANDLFTAGCSPSAMAGVAETVANKRRHELTRLVGAKNARFIFVNLAKPESSVRYQDLLAEKKGTRLDNLKKKFGGGVEKEIRSLRDGVELYNKSLREYTGKNGDGYVDIAQGVDPAVVGGMLNKLGLIQGAQEEGTSSTYVSARSYDNREKQYKSVLTHLTTSDKAHPTDPVYKYLWTLVRTEILNRQYTFGDLAG